MNEYVAADKNDDDDDINDDIVDRYLSARFTVYMKSSVWKPLVSPVDCCPNNCAWRACLLHLDS